MRTLAHRRASSGRRFVSAALVLLAELGAFGCSKERIVDLGGGVKMSLVLLPAGTFTMGTTEAEIVSLLRKWPDAKPEWFARELPAHKVTLSKAFWMGNHEVTVGQFRRFMAARKAYETDAQKGLKIPVFVEGKGPIVESTNWLNPSFPQSDDHPVVCVSWNDALAFVNWLNATDKGKPPGLAYGLPTEAEWEYACRAGTTTLYQWGDEPDMGKGWCNAADLMTKKSFPDSHVFNWDDGFLYTAPVGSFEANAFGLYDMHGNVWEWCQDKYGPYYPGDQTDPSGPPSDVTVADRIVLRGGSWGGSPVCLRCSAREGAPPEGFSGRGGFRLVLRSVQD